MFWCEAGGSHFLHGLVSFWTLFCVCVVYVLGLSNYVVNHLVVLYWNVLSGNDNAKYIFCGSVGVLTTYSPCSISLSHNEKSFSFRYLNCLSCFYLSMLEGEFQLANCFVRTVEHVDIHVPRPLYDSSLWEVHRVTFAIFGVRVHLVWSKTFRYRVTIRSCYKTLFH